MVAGVEELLQRLNGRDQGSGIREHRSPAGAFRAGPGWWQPWPRVRGGRNAKVMGRVFAWAIVRAQGERVGLSGFAFKSGYAAER